MARILIFAVIMVLAISGATGEMRLSEITLSVSGVVHNYTGTVYEADQTEMSWFIDGFPVVSSFVNTEEGYPDLEQSSDPIFIQDEALYGFSYKVSGMDVTSTLTIKTEAGRGVVMLKIRTTSKTYSMTSNDDGEATTEGAVVATTTPTSAMLTTTATTMFLSQIIATESDTERNYTATVHYAVKTQLKWMMNGDDVVSATINVVEDGSLNSTDPINRINITDDNLYGLTFEISGPNITTTLTIKNAAGYGDVSFSAGAMNSSIPMTSSTSTLESASKPHTTEEMVTSVTSETTSTLPMSTDGGATSATSEPTDHPTAFTEDPAESTTSGLTVLPGCDVGGHKCNRSITFNCSREVTMERCTVSYHCKDDRYAEPNVTCQGQRVCISPGVWSTKCDRLCGQGCPKLNNRTAIHICDATTGQCVDNVTKALLRRGDCSDGWTGDLCDIPICDPQHCNGGVCLAPNFCGNCPRHYESGATCRNISLDGFSKGSLPTLAILAAVVIILKLASDYYIRWKKKNH